MSITLNWKNRGQAVTAVKIYRGTSRIVPFTLLTTLGVVETYTDDTVEINKLYYYQIALVINGEEIPGAILPLATLVDTGPGPTTLQNGTMEFGYFGKLTTAEFFTTAGLNTAISGIPGFTTLGTLITYWRKLAHFGKILYVPDVPSHVVGSSMAPLAALNTLYGAGLLYGHGKTDKHSLITGTAVMQNKRVTKDQYEFIFRLPKAGLYSDPTTSYFVNVSSLESLGSELYLISSNTPNGSINGPLISTANAFPRIGTPETIALTIYFLTQNFVGTNSVATSYLPSVSVSNMTAGVASASIYVLPVLELVLS